MSIQFPNVPSLPGVPNLLRNPAIAKADSLLSGGINVAFPMQADAPGLPADAAQEAWGIYANGQPAIVPDTIVGTDFRAESRVSDYPIEEGAFGSYNKVQQPFDFMFTMSYAGNAKERKEFLNKLEALLKDTATLYSAVTPERSWDNITIERYDYRRDARAGVQMLTVQVLAREVRVVKGDSYTQPSGQDTGQATQQTQQNTGTQPLAPENTKSPDASDLKNQGNVQATPPTPAQDGASNYAAGSANDSFGGVLSPNAAQQIQQAQQDPERMRATGMDRINNPPPGLNDEQLATYKARIKETYGITD